MKIRPSSRLLIIDPEDRILLFHTLTLDEPMDPQLNIEEFWHVPGGGLEPDETFEQAAWRELWEETGIRDGELGPCVWIREKVLHFPSGFGEALSHERFFPVWVEHSDPVLDNLTGFEADAIAGYRWWSLNALHRTTDIVFPEKLAEHLEPILQREFPAQPLTIG